MPQYRLAARTEADDLNAKAEASALAALRDIQRSTNYVLCVVLFAVGVVLRRHEYEARDAAAPHRDALRRLCASSWAPPSGSPSRPSASPSDEYVRRCPVVLAPSADGLFGRPWVNITDRSASSATPSIASFSAST